MGCGSSTDSATALKQKELDDFLEKERLQADLDFKILILGAGESGKSTVIKQLRNIHQGMKVMSEDDLKSFKPILHTNTLQSLRFMVRACNFLKISLTEYMSSLETLVTIKENDVVIRENGLINIEQANIIDMLQKTDAFQEAWSKKYSIYIPDSSPYYFNNILRFAHEDFIPNEDDIVMARVRTTGMFMSAFDDPPLHQRVVDVGGQRSERKKQIRFFDDVQAILFVVNLAGYSQVLFEDSKTNRMLESLELFEQISQNHCFSNTPIFLFLNKKDLFEECLRQTDINTLFPDYNGADTTQDKLDFIGQQFQKRMPETSKIVSINYISARYKRDVRYAFEDVKDFLKKLNQKKIDKAVKLRNMN